MKRVLVLFLLTVITFVSGSSNVFASERDVNGFVMPQNISGLFCGDGDSYEDNDSFSEAATINMGTNSSSMIKEIHPTLHGKYLCPNDKDYFKVVLTAKSDFLGFWLKDIPGNNDYDMRIYSMDADGNLTSMFNSPASGNQDEYRAFLDLDSGTYIVEIKSAYGYDGSNPYTLQIENRSRAVYVDTGGLSWTDHENLEDDYKEKVGINFYGDKDYYKIVPTKTSLGSIKTYSGSNMRVTLYDKNLNVIQSNIPAYDNQNSELHYYFEKGEEYFVSVSGDMGVYYIEYVNDATIDFNDLCKNKYNVRMKDDHCYPVDDVQVLREFNLDETTGSQLGNYIDGTQKVYFDWIAESHELDNPYYDYVITGRYAVINHYTSNIYTGTPYYNSIKYLRFNVYFNNNADSSVRVKVEIVNSTMLTYNFNTGDISLEYNDSGLGLVNMKTAMFSNLPVYNRSSSYRQLNEEITTDPVMKLTYDLAGAAIDFTPVIGQAKQIYSTVVTIGEDIMHIVAPEDANPVNANISSGDEDFSPMIQDEILYFNHEIGKGSFEQEIDQFLIGHSENEDFFVLYEIDPSSNKNNFEALLEIKFSVGRIRTDGTVAYVFSDTEKRTAYVLDAETYVPTGC